MGRWRPPQAKGSTYITAAGMAVLKDELNELWNQRRPEVVKALSAAAAEGDRSENAEYIYRKKELAGIDRRVRFLRKRIPELKVVDTTPTDPSKVFFGATVTLETEAGDEVCYTVVGPDEFEVSAGKISMDAPLAKQMMGRTVDDEIAIQVNGERQCFWIVKIEYR